VRETGLTVAGQPPPSGATRRGQLGGRTPQASAVDQPEFQRWAADRSRQLQGTEPNIGCVETSLEDRLDPGLGPGLGPILGPILRFGLELYLKGARVIAVLGGTAIEARAPFPILLSIEGGQVTYDPRLGLV
jgi:hypothetical protein